MVHSKQSLQLTNSMKEQLTVSHNQLLVIQLRPTEGKRRRRKKKRNKEHFFPVLSNFHNSNVLLQNSLAVPTCLLMSMGHCWNNTERTKLNHLEEMVPEQLYPLQIHWDWPGIDCDKVMTKHLIHSTASSNPKTHIKIQFLPQRKQSP